MDVESPADAVTAILPAASPGMAVVAVDPPSRRVLPALCLGSFVTSLAFVAPTPFLAVIAADLGVGVPLLGQVVTAQLLLGAALALAAGPLADHHGHRRLVVLGLVAASASPIGSGLAPAFSVLLLAGLGSGLADATVSGLSLAIAGTRFTGPASRRAISWTIAALAGAPVIGVPLLTAAGDVAGWRVAFIGAGLGAVAVAALVAAWLPSDEPGTSGPLRWRALRDAYHPLLRHRPVQRLYAASVLRAICWFGLLTYLGAFLDEEVGLGTRRAGLAYMLAGGAYFLASLAAGGPLARLPARPLLAGGNAVMALLVGLVFSSTLGVPSTVAILAIACAAGATGWVGLAALLAAESPAGTGTTMTLNSALFNLGAAGGGAAGGLLLATGGYGALALGLPAFGLVSALLAWPSGTATGQTGDE
ncbi:MAG: MFS transporter [Chloroflexota bacterium]|nr:MFS transporter [Chloroflexota bacterium]